VTRNHRRWHAWMWLILAPLIAAGFLAGLLARSATRDETNPVGIRLGESAPRVQEKVP
jgi:hypothetical protein